MNYFIDSNCLWWFIVKTSKYHKKVKEGLNEILEEEDHLFINDFVIFEFMHPLIKSLGSNKGEPLLELLLSSSLISRLNSRFDIPYFRLIWKHLVKYGVTTSISSRDATIIDTMKKFGIHNIISHDQAFDKVEGITLFDPLL